MPLLLPRIVITTMGRPWMVTPSVVPVLSTVATWSRTHWLELGSYAPSIGMAPGYVVKGLVVRSRSCVP